MTMLEKKVDALLRAVTAEDEETRKNARAEAKALLDGDTPTTVVKEFALKDCIQNLLLEIGMQPNLLGFDMCAEAIALCVKDKTYMQEYIARLYPEVAANNDSTASRTERAIRHAIEKLFERSDWDLLTPFFANSISPTKDKPTNSEFISRMRVEVLRRMR